MVPVPSRSKKGKCPTRCEEPATIGFNTRPTKRHRTEPGHGVHPQQHLRPINDPTQFNIQNINASPIGNEDFHMHTATNIDAGMDSKRPRSADMCGQFEDIVGALRPPCRRSPRPLSSMSPAPPEVRENNFFDFSRYNEERIFHSQHQEPNQTFISPSMTMEDTHQSITDTEPSDGDTVSYLPYLDMDIGSGDFQLLESYPPDLSMNISFATTHEPSPSTWRHHNIYSPDIWTNPEATLKYDHRAPR